MRNRGNEIIFHPFCSTEFLCHIVNGFTQFSDFVIFKVFNACIKIALRNAFSRAADVCNRC